jgi:hypothetical protein
MPRRVPIALNFGRKDIIAPEHAPHGVLKSATNLRHREVGGLGMRHGYQALPMTTADGTLVAYDLHEYLGRLVALGSDVGEGYPHAIYEYNGLNQAAAWRRVGHPYGVSPLTNAREVAGVPHVEGGVSLSQAVSGNGHTLLVYKSRDQGDVFALVVDSTTNATLHFENLSDGALSSSASDIRLAYASGVFYCAAGKDDNSLVILRFQVAASSAFTSFATVSAASADSLSAFDLVPVANNTTALLCAAFDRGTNTDLTIRLYNASGSQVGSDITLGSTDTRMVALDADQADDTILVLTRDSSGGAVNLRTFNFAGSVVAGPTAMTSGLIGSVARRSGGVSSDTAFVGVYTSQDYVIQSCAADDHSSLASVQTIANFKGFTRLLSLPGPTMRLLVGGTSEANSGDAVSNALFFVGPGVVHQLKRDYLNGGAFGLPLLPLTIDVDAGHTITWCTRTDSPLGNFGIPKVTLVDFASTNRVQGVTYGGLRYFAGAAPWIYDGRSATEAGFIEPPVIIGADPENVTGGDLTPEGKYTWVVHWEVSFADGSYIESAPSLPKTRTLGPSDNACELTITGPHSLHTVLGDGELGASVTLVISRTEWSASTTDVATGLPGAQFSQFRRAIETDIDAGVANYGANVIVTDDVGDETLATRGVIYTQAERGQFSGTLEHNAPESCRYITATESRILTGGLLRPHEVQISKEAFLGQPFAWSVFSNFYGLVSGAVLGVHALDGAKLVFTRDEIYALREGAPDDEGKGTLGLPVRIPTPSGLKDWRSLLEMPDGLACQLDDNKLFRIPRGGGAPDWFGADIHRLFLDFQSVVGAALHKADNCALFALSNGESGEADDARIAVRDFLFQSWLIDEPPLEPDSGIEALAALDRAVAYLSGGVVYAQFPGVFSDDGDAFIDCELETNPIYPVGPGGYGIISDLLASCEYRGDCVLTIDVSYDDGLTYPVTKSWTISGLTPGATVRRKLALPTEATSSVALRASVTTAGAASEGLVLNEITLLAEPTEGLPDLLPAEEG